MKAIQYTAFGTRPKLVEIDKPSPGPGEVLLRITASGLCHSDEFVMMMPEEGYPLSDADDVRARAGRRGGGARRGCHRRGSRAGGDRVRVLGCGVCEMCADGSENLCLNGMISPGLGTNGAMAEFMVVDTPRHLVPIGDLDPVPAASLTDAALTPYQAIKECPAALGRGSTTVVIGAGGLGHFALQLQRQLTPTRVIALDIGQDKLDFAKENGAHEAFESNAEAAEQVKSFTGGRGASVVLDFVGAGAGGLGDGGVRRDSDPDDEQVGLDR